MGVAAFDPLPSWQIVNQLLQLFQEEQLPQLRLVPQVHFIEEIQRWFQVYLLTENLLYTYGALADDSSEMITS